MSKTESNLSILEGPSWFLALPIFFWNLHQLGGERLNWRTPKFWILFLVKRWTCLEVFWRPADFEAYYTILTPIPLRRFGVTHPPSSHLSLIPHSPLNPRQNALIKAFAQGYVINDKHPKSIRVACDRPNRKSSPWEVFVWGFLPINCCCNGLKLGVFLVSLVHHE